ncbi:MAG: DUF2194 domain-containing protein [Pseudomonadota bacterium]
MAEVGTERPAQRVLVVSDTSDAPARLAVENTHAAFDCARIGHDVFDLSADAPWPDLKNYSAVITATENLGLLAPEHVASLFSFVEAGGGVAAVYRAQPSKLDKLFGMISCNTPFSIRAADSGGIRFPGQTLPAFEGIQLTSEGMIGHASLDQIPDRGVEVLATTWSGKPIAWALSVGRGRTAYWNSVFLSQKRARGLIIQTLEVIQPLTLAPVVNAGVVQIDDFPAPLVGHLPGFVQEEFPELSPEAFYSDVWCPDMFGLAERHGLKYSCFCVFDYVELHELEAAGIDPADHRPAADAFEPIQRYRPPEMGLHGYNHQSLQLRDWPDITEMTDALGHAKELWASFGCGALPTSYVPPNNQYDVAGIRALAGVFPSIKVISGSFFGRTEDGANREFGPEPWKPDLFCLPRTTCGYECTDETLFDSASQLATLGVWTHFLHPDDLLDVPEPNTSPIGRRNPHRRPWRSRNGVQGLLDQAAALFSSIARRFPWLTYRTTAETADLVQEHLASDWTIGFGDKSVSIAGPEGGLIRLRVNRWGRRHMNGLSGCEVVYETVGRHHTAYILKMTAQEARVTLSGTAWIADMAGRIKSSQPPMRKAS